MDSIFSGPNLIIAGPGTGKTTFLINKIEDFIKLEETSSRGLIVCTFTKKATEELKIRLGRKVNSSKLSSINFLIGTIHSICFELLSRYSEKALSDFEIISEEQQINFIHSKLSNLGFSSGEIRKDGWLVSRELATIFNKITDQEIDIDKIDFADNLELEDYSKVYSTYRRLLLKNRLFDYATLQKSFLQEISINRSFKELVSQDFSHVFVDEYQDVNDMQDQIFKILTSPLYNLTVVGDDDQSIYGFRGSNIKNIYTFQDWFKEKNIPCSVFYLDVNYRSTKSIVDLTNETIRNKSNRYITKNIKAKRNHVSHKPICNVFDNDIDEAAAIISFILKLKEENIVSRFSDIGILFRSVKSHSAVLVKELIDNQIPYKLTSAGDLFNSPIGLEFLNLLDYYLAKDIDKEEILFDNLAKIDVLFNTDLTSVYTDSNFIETLERCFESQFGSCLGLIYEIFNSVDFIQRYEEDGFNIGQLTSLAFSYDNFSSLFDPFGFYSYLTYLKRSSGVDLYKDDLIDSVQIMTIHQSKGLEFPVVIMPSLNDRKSRRSILDKFNELAGIEENDDEERRIFYVGCTRAEDLLFLSSTKHLVGRNKVYQPIKYFLEIFDNEFSTKSLDLNVLNSQNFRKKHSEKSEELVLSYNSLKLYEICPKAYQFSYEWKLESIRIGGQEYGRIVHRIVELILKQIKDGCSTERIDVLSLVDDNWTNKTFRSYDENEKFKKSATSQISNFVKNFSVLFKGYSIDSIEEEFNIMINDDLITGRMDFVLKSDKKVLIVDLKTGDKNDYSDQLSFYSLCYRKKYPQYDNIEMGVYYLKSSDFEWISGNNEIDDVRRIEHHAKSIKEKDFRPTPGKHCSSCSFESICRFKL